MSPYLDQIGTAVRAVRFRSPLDVRWFGRPVIEWPRRLTGVLKASQVRAGILTGIQDQLYSNFYCQAAALPSFDGQDQSASRARIAEFVDQLSNANAGVGYWGPGWEVRRVDAASLEVERYRLAVRVRASDCDLPTGTVLSPGSVVSVRGPKELVGRSPGYYIAMGNAWLPDGQWHNVLRLYWNVTAEGAIDLVRLATRLLNEAGVPFQLKVLTQLARVSRCDAAVLYLHRRQYAEVSAILDRIHRGIAPRLRPPVPSLTKALAPGLALAEDPGNGLSFGEHRCHLLAQALVRANERGKRSFEGRLRIVVEHFTEAGISVDRPYLNPGSEDAYRFEPRESLPRHVAGDRTSSDGPVSLDEVALVSTAHRIGRQICREARWSGGRCNWMGATVDDRGRAGSGALGPCLYAGTSGVAWFLAALHEATADPNARATALGAIEQALRSADSVAAAERVGVFTGWVGIVLAAARVGLVLKEPDLLDRARQLLHRLDPAPGAVSQWDYLSGAAGAVAGLLALNALCPDLASVDVAVRLGDAILDAATKRAAHWSWRTTNRSREVNLTGLSHGAAGIACALLELFRLTRDARYRRAAELAFQYERGWFAADRGNWPDLRGYPAREVRRTDVLPCGSVWCHGAPGIALSRLRAYEITGDDQFRLESRIALDTTHALTEVALHSNAMNFSLCHGFAGNGEILHLGTRALGVESPRGSALVADIARAGIDRYDRAGRPWPCGAAGPTPALMTGLAGMGYFYLRLADPALPSILLLTPEDFARTVSPSGSPATSEPPVARA